MKCNRKNGRTLQASLMVQGDYQIELMQFSKSQKLRAFERRSFLEILATTFRKMNHEFKEKETWYH
jgi:hypothetical protein